MAWKNLDVDGQNGVFFTSAKFILAKELICAYQAWSIVREYSDACVLISHLAHVEPRLMESFEVESCVRGHSYVIIAFM